MRHARPAQWLGLGLACLASFLACGESGVVGGECRAGLVLCNGNCVDTSVDEAHCGGCNIKCARGVSCDDGTCASGGSNAGGTGGVSGAGGAAGEAGAPGTSSAGMGGSGGGGAGTGGGSGGTDASGGSGGTAGSGGSGGSGGPACPGPLDTPEQCGGCDTVCEGSTPNCAPVGGGDYECVNDCEPLLELCGRQCVDTQTNPRHCGRCGNVCASGVCVDGACVGATAGHVVYACMNYEQVFAQSAQITVLGNAVFLLNREPAKILAYSSFARNPVMNAVDRAIGRAGTAIGRTAEITREADPAVVETTLSLADYDVFLVYDQSLAPGGELASVGAQLSTVLDDFTHAGGVVLMLSSGTGTAEMGEFASNAGLLDVGVESDWTGELVYNQASGDAIGIGVITPFTTSPLSCTFETSEIPSSATVFVVTDTDPADGVGQPVVVHKTVNP